MKEAKLNKEDIRELFLKEFKSDAKEGDLDLNTIADFFLDRWPESTPTGECCGRCENNIGGGSTMLPRVRACSNLDCPCHRPTLEVAPPTNIESMEEYANENAREDVKRLLEAIDWEREFDEKFPVLADSYNDAAADDAKKDVKSFIRQLLASERTAERERIKKMVEGLRRNLPEKEAYASGQGMYNQALDDVSVRLTKHDE